MTRPKSSSTNAVMPPALTPGQVTRIRLHSFQELVVRIMDLETHAHQLGLTLTAQSLNRAKNVGGWEMAGDSKMAALAINGERPEKPKPRIRTRDRQN